MKKGFFISALAVFAVALFLRFALVGYSFLALSSIISRWGSTPLSVR